MNLKTDYKTFPDQPAWNSVAALGAMVGFAAGVVVPAQALLPQEVVANLGDGAALLVWVAIGALIGAAVGRLLSNREEIGRRGSG